MKKIIVGTICIVALLLLNVTASTQSKAKKTTPADKSKQVTITLVRWPYT